jgi:hypothetical protein
VARTWLRIKVELVGGGGIVCDQPPGRVFIVGPGHTFEQLAAAIDAAFARWDLSHLHEFELGDGRLIGYPDDSYGPELVWLDHAKLKVTREVKPGEEFGYTFDLEAITGGIDASWKARRPSQCRSTGDRRSGWVAGGAPTHMLPPS